MFSSPGLQLTPCVKSIGSCLLAKGAIDKLPVMVPSNQGLTDKLVNEKLSILSEPTFKFFKSEPMIFEADFMKAGAVATAIKSRIAPQVTSNKYGRITLNSKRGDQQSSSYSRKSVDLLAPRQYHTRNFTNSSHNDTTRVAIKHNESHKDSVIRAKDSISEAIMW